MCELLTSMVWRLGFEGIAKAHSTQEALDILEFDAIGLALVDLGLGDEDGGTLISAMREHKRECIRSLPIVVVSQTTTRTRILEAIKAGADGFIAKPLSFEAFYRLVSLAAVKRALPPRPAPAPERRPQDILDAVRAMSSDADILEID